MSFPADFCDGSADAYKPHPNIESYVENPGDDLEAKYHNFHQRYSDWMDAGHDSDLAVMAFFFGSTDDSRAALEAGRTDAEGRVIESDCQAFVNFVEAAEAESQLIAESDLEGAEPDLAAKSTLTMGFEEAIRAYVMGKELTPIMRGLLNGACFLRNERQETDLSGGEQRTITEFYAIPGYDMYRNYRQNLSDPLWNGIMTSLKDASDSANMPMINLDIAMQLRLGQAGTSQPYPPQSIGSGFVIFGAG